MKPTDVLAGLRDPAPCFRCRDLRNRSSTDRYRVPLLNRPLPCFNLEAPEPEASAQALADLPDLPSTRQLRAILANNLGLGLWAPAQRVRSSGTPEQEAFGSLIVFPPNEWASLLDEFVRWQFDGVDEAFSGLPYTVNDVVPFAGPNFSPDRWLLILRGPMAGNVCWWSHDGDTVMEEPWARDIRSWGDRIFAEAPDVLGGVVRFSAIDSVDAPPADAELLPIEYRADCRRR